jgi:hypothetical protein
MKNEASRMARVMSEIYTQNKSKYPDDSSVEVLRRVVYPNLDKVPDRSRKRAEICCETVNGMCYMEVLDCGKFKRAMNFRSLQFTHYMDKELEAQGFPKQSRVQKEKILEAMNLKIDGWDRASHD